MFQIGRDAVGPLCTINLCDPPLRATRNMHHTQHNMQHATWITCNTACNVQHATCSIQHMQHATWRSAAPPATRYHRRRIGCSRIIRRAAGRAYKYLRCVASPAREGRTTKLRSGGCRAAAAVCCRQRRRLRGRYRLTAASLAARARVASGRQPLRLQVFGVRAVRAVGHRQPAARAQHGR